MMEQILEDAAKANPNLSVVLLRYFTPIGAHVSGHIGAEGFNLGTGMPYSVLEIVHAFDNIPVSMRLVPS